MMGAESPMKSERWRQVEELFHAALERTPEERQAFLERHEPTLTPEERSALRATYWDDDRIDWALAFGG